jgi:hypothetical protein
VHEKGHSGDIDDKYIERMTKTEAWTEFRRIPEWIDAEENIQERKFNYVM